MVSPPIKNVGQLGEGGTQPSDTIIFTHFPILCKRKKDIIISFLCGNRYISKE